MKPTIQIVNPLGAALHHYQVELRSILEVSGCDVAADSHLEPSASGGSRIMWLLRGYLAVLRGRLSGADLILVVWPMAGFLDVVIAQLLAGRRGAVVFHDPDPLVRAAGYGRGIRRLAKWCKSVRLIVHSEAAARDMAAQGFATTTMVLHPIELAERPRANRGRQSVVVVGQYKPDRDLALLEALARRLPEDADLRIHGRGWPEVLGWTVDNRFLPEAELVGILREAGVVVIPYRRFYQSGVAIRALESGSAVVGPAGTSLDTLLASAPELLARGGDVEGWARAVAAAQALSADGIDSLAREYAGRVVTEWTELVRQFR